MNDSSDNIALMSRRLKDTYRTIIATNGAKALKIASSEDPPDLILLDIMMPGMDGYEVCRSLKEDPKTAKIPIIFLTAKVDDITKPISTPILLARIRTHLQ